MFSLGKEQLDNFDSLIFKLDQNSDPHKIKSCRPSATLPAKKHRGLININTTHLSNLCDI